MGVGFVSVLSFFLLVYVLTSILEVKNLLSEMSKFVQSSMSVKKFKNIEREESNDIHMPMRQDNKNKTSIFGHFRLKSVLITKQHFSQKWPTFQKKISTLYFVSISNIQDNLVR